MKRSVIRIIGFLVLMGMLLALPSQAEIIRKGAEESKKIALSFDDGPSERNTEAILALLEKYQIKATFFVIGENAERDPDRIRKISDAGHEIGNHTYHHQYITKLNEAQLREEILKTESLLTEICGKRPVLFRPPGGAYSDKALQRIEEMGYTSVLWSVDTHDWTKPKIATIVTVVEKNVLGGDIILFHDLEQKNSPTPAALDIIIPFFQEKGYEFVTVSELLQEQGG